MEEYVFLAAFSFPEEIIMKAKLKAKITNFDKTDGKTILSIQGFGKTETNNINAQETVLNGTLTLKSLIADQMRLGATITIIVSDEETE